MEMTTVLDFINAVDQYLAAPKRIVGATSPPIWRQGREIGGDAQEIKLPIEVGGEQHESQKFVVCAFPNADELMFSIGITYRWAVCRLDYEPTRRHSNAGYVNSSGDSDHYHWKSLSFMVGEQSINPGYNQAL